ncbi:hypothetical protein AAW12_04930 [Sphingobacterium sp. Ag1]|uniref:MauE/DoxX family redox-associated membrane protein n=1 Tax=Sphingobacterium sp. Ag1 TaxID=1643451 RepID=UPI000630CFA2|nr:MauE/DoxX family redox-associated membrane protein [Sphingobacterium sp. Ag1]KKO92449.1 hypothetical protein AAW12_04930 [Sphingobacterium sp. Ag1]
MENTNRHTVPNNYLAQRTTIDSPKTLRRLLRWLRIVVRFCLVHWRDITLTFYGSFMMGLWIFVAYNKFSDFNGNMDAMLRQPLPRPLAIVLAYLIPTSEILAAVLIGIKSTRLIGFILSSLMMLAFTGYVGLALLHVWSDELPCSCGLIIQIGWKSHFILNIYLTIICIWPYILARCIQKRPTIHGRYMPCRGKIACSIPRLSYRSFSKHKDSLFHGHNKIK